MALGNGFTPTERKMLEALGDGNPHRRQVLVDCLPDEVGGALRPQNIRMHLTRIRKKLRPRGMDIICQWTDGNYHYRWIRLLRPPGNEHPGPGPFQDDTPSPPEAVT